MLARRDRLASEHGYDPDQVEQDVDDAIREVREERTARRPYTNVWVSGLIVRRSPPGRVVDAALDGRFDVVASWELAEEIVEVLRRPKLRRYEIKEADVADVVAALAPLLPGVEVTVGLRDVADAPVLATVAVASAEAVVTGDRDLLDEPHVKQWCSAGASRC